MEWKVEWNIIPWNKQKRKKWNGNGKENLRKTQVIATMKSVMEWNGFYFDLIARKFNHYFPFHFPTFLCGK